MTLVLEIFILGLIFGLVLLPIFDGLTSLFLSFFEMIKSYFAVIIANNNQKIHKLSIDSPKCQIGFDLGEEVENDDI